ncbi:ribosome small subunit-dependent GTPase A [Candidatus Stoquefichus massiliensis]|uniref:ribosome small subunit-dependent GTPase A n=1 Tax=Candidatus Stoquefichus massiliensis TaxID=1470350 RepID=UPI0004816C6E|nr:ribosome small subunit-dependent GTPase A [Candidatus Stoquefichus massiliensis]
MQSGLIIKALSGFYYVEDHGYIYQCRARGKFRKDDQKPLVGDYCEFTIENETDGYVRKLLPRRNVLIRPPICNVDQALLVFSAKEPDINTLLLDRFLVLIEHLDIEPIICISKMDLVSQSYIQAEMTAYEKAGYRVYYVSARENQGIEDIKHLFKDKVTVITGQSGVGKSSLLNALDIHLNIDTNEISKALGRGKHTTRHVELLKMYGGYVADTPGFSSLELEMEPIDIAHSFHDFKELSQTCKFRGCLHDSEPHCSVKEAVDLGNISKERYEHYLMFLKESKLLKEKKYG